MIKKIHLLGYLIIGNIIMKKEYGDAFIIYLKPFVKKEKSLIVEPGVKAMSFQKHVSKEDEIWMVSDGGFL